MNWIKNWKLFESSKENDFFISDEDIKDALTDMLDDDWEFGESSKFYLSGGRKFYDNNHLSNYYPIHQFELMLQVDDSDESYDGGIYYSDSDNLMNLNKSLGMLKRLLGKGFKVKYNTTKTSTDILIIRVRIIYPMVKGSEFDINEFFSFVNGLDSVFSSNEHLSYYLSYPMNLDTIDGDFFIFGITKSPNKHLNRIIPDKINFNWVNDKYVSFNRLDSYSPTEIFSIEGIVNNINFSSATNKDLSGNMYGNINALKSSFNRWISKFGEALDKKFNLDIKYNVDSSPNFLDNSIGVKSIDQYKWVILDKKGNELIEIVPKVCDSIIVKVSKNKTHFFKDNSINLEFPIYSLVVTFNILV